MLKRYCSWIFILFTLAFFSACGSDQDRGSTTTDDRQAPVTAPQPQEQTQQRPQTVAQDPDAEQLELVVKNLQFSPREVKVEKGERIQITLINEGEVETSVRFEIPGSGQELRNTVPPGQRAAIIFTAPDKAGTYPFYSPVRNQRDRGLTGQLVVE